MTDITNIYSYCFKSCEAPDLSFIIPFDGSVPELIHIFMFENNLPLSFYHDMCQELDDAISAYNSNFFNDKMTALIKNVKTINEPLEDVTKQWEMLMHTETMEFSEKRCASDEELFAVAYHKLVHSPVLEKMQELEHRYAKTVWGYSEDKDEKIESLKKKQTEEMNDAVDRLEKGITESQINEIVGQHFEEQSLLYAQVTSKLESIKETQRREYRRVLMQVVESNSDMALIEELSHSPEKIIPAPLPVSKGVNLFSTLEESFTIHLGSQLKQMHNIRILSCDVAAFFSAENHLSEPTPQSLQTSLALYSSDLCGLVIMTDNVVGSRQTKDFATVCRKSTEFHFLQIDDQFEKISNEMKQNTPKHQRNSCKLQSGDFYITKHSNLSQVHLVFHMVSDDSLRGHEINSRHSVVLGLRNILKTACSNDITSLTIPLLLQYEITEDMTVSWCTKRAELVFKCVKGFMIEMATWGGSDLKNLQFLLPHEISGELFQSLTLMLPSIFKVSNPLILKSNLH